MKAYVCDKCGCVNDKKFDSNFYAHAPVGRFTIKIHEVELAPESLFRPSRPADLCPKCLIELMEKAFTDIRRGG